MAQIVKSSEIDLSKLSKDESLWLYNGLDCLVTTEVYNNVRPQLDTPIGGNKVTYDFERAMLGPALTMVRRGLGVDTKAVQRLLPPLLEARVKVVKLLNSYGHAVMGKDINHNSPLQLKSLFYETLNIPKIFRNDKGKKKISTNREAMETMMRMYPRARPFVMAIMKLRDIDKQVSVLMSKTDADGRIRCSYNVAGTETGRWSSSESPFRTGCVLPDTEVLTREGWVKISELPEGVEVMEWSADTQSAVFVIPKIVSFPFEGNLLKFKSTQLELTVTPKHRMISWNSRMDHMSVRFAEDMPKHFCLPKAGGYDPRSKFYCAEFLQILVMLLADASLEDNSFRISFKKERKIKRCLELLDKHGVEYTENAAKEGYRRFRLTVSSSAKFLSFLGGKKRWGNWIFNLNLPSRRIMLDELKHWDGHARGMSTVFYTTDEEQAKWVSTLASITGAASTMYSRCNFKGYNKNPDALLWFVNIQDKAHARINKNKHHTLVPYSGYVWCLQVPFKFFYVRQNGVISITGNTNLQNVTNEMRIIYVPDKGKKLFYADLEQAESRVVAYLAEDENYIAACEAGDLHTDVVKMIWPNRGWTDDAKENRRLADEPYFLHFSYRDICKRAGHGTNYGLTAHSLARQLKIKVATATLFQLNYYGGEVKLSDVDRWHKQMPDGGFDQVMDTAERVGKNLLEVEGAFSGIRRWHDETSRLLNADGQLTTPFGRVRQFWSRLSDPSTLREAIAFIPQSTIGDLLNVGLYRVWRELEPDVELLGQVHDAIFGQVWEKDLDKYMPLVLDCMVNPLEINGRTMIVPSSIEVGDNWCHYNDDPSRGQVNLVGIHGWEPNVLHK